MSDLAEQSPQHHRRTRVSGAILRLHSPPGAASVGNIPPIPPIPSMYREDPASQWDLDRLPQGAFGHLTLERVPIQAHKTRPDHPPPQNRSHPRIEDRKYLKNTSLFAYKRTMLVSWFSALESLLASTDHLSLFAPCSRCSSYTGFMESIGFICFQLFSSL